MVRLLASELAAIRFRAASGSFEKIFLIDDKGREAVKCAQTDSNQAEDICPARFSSALPDPRIAQST
jgi:hypothetical protein